VEEVVVSRLGAADEVDRPEQPSNLGLYVLRGILVVSAGVALVLQWISLRQRR
jgi:hypothetical protein